MDPGGAQGQDEVGEPVPVGGDRHLLDSGGAGSVGRDIHHVSPQGGLAAGEPDAADPEGGEGVKEAGDSGLGEGGLVGLLFRGGAVGAAEVAAAGEREPEVADEASLGVRELWPSPREGEGGRGL